MRLIVSAHILSTQRTPDITHDMVSTRSFFPQSRTVRLPNCLINRRTEYFSIKSYEARLRSRLYPSASSSPCQVSVITRQICPSSVYTRHPFPENHLGELQLQPYVHNCAVIIPIQASLPVTDKSMFSSMVQGNATTIQGDVIIMRLGSINFNT